MRDDRELQLKKELLIKSCLEKGDPSLFMGFDKSVGDEVLTRREQEALLKLCHSEGDEVEFDYSELDMLGLELLSIEDVCGIADQVATYRSRENESESEDVVVIIKKIINEEIKRKRSF